MPRLFIILLTISFLLASLSPSRVIARPEHQPDPNVIVIPLTCQLCETRVSPDGKTVAVFENRDMAGGEVTSQIQIAITLLDITGGKTQGKLIGRLTGQTDFATDVAFSPDSRTLAALHANGALRLWDVKARKLISELFLGVGGGRLAISADGKSIAASRQGMPQSLWLIDRQSGDIGQILTWRFRTMAEFMQLVGDAKTSLGFTISAWALSTDGKQAAVATFNDDIWLFDTAKGTSLQILRGDSEAFGRASIRRLGYTPDGGSLYFSDNRTHAPRLFSLAVMTDTLPAAPSARLDPEIVNATDHDLYGLTLAPDGRTFAWVDQSPGPDDREQPQLLTALVNQWWQPEVVATLLPADLRATPLTSVHFTPDGRLIAGGFAAPNGENALIIVSP
jgi:WD40 repeat protein